MKKIICLFLLFFISFVNNAYAQKCDDCYINKNGVVITNSQLEKLKEIGYSFETIDFMTQDTYDSFGTIDSVDQKTEEKYFRETIVYGKINNYSIIEEINKNDYDLEVPISEEKLVFSRLYNLTSSTSTDTYETTYKKLSVTITKTSASNPNKRNVMSSLTWKRIPSVISYDIYASRVTNGVIVANSQSGSMKHTWRTFDQATCGYGATVSHTTSISTSSPAWNKSTSGLGYSGVGFTAQLASTTEMCFNDYYWVYSPVTGYSSTMGYNATTTGNALGVYITYQHATTNVSYNSVYNSYSFSNSGLGNVVYFSNNTLMSSYDGMGGIYLSY